MDALVVAEENAKQKLISAKEKCDTIISDAQKHTQKIYETFVLQKEMNEKIAIEQANKQAVTIKDSVLDETKKETITLDELYNKNINEAVSKIIETILV